MAAELRAIAIAIEPASDDVERGYALVMGQNTHLVAVETRIQNGQPAPALPADTGAVAAATFAPENRIFSILTGPS